MTRRDLVALYGRLGLVVVVFALITGIIASPVLSWIWSPITMTAR